MRRKGKRKGFTLVEIMLGISILGVLAALSIPAILGAYSNAQKRAMERNVAEVEKAKGILTLPSQIGMTGAMGLTSIQSFSDAGVTENLCKVLRINSMSDLNVGNMTLNPGSLTEKAYYE